MKKAKKKMGTINTTINGTKQPGDREGVGESDDNSEDSQENMEKHAEIEYLNDQLQQQSSFVTTARRTSQTVTCGRRRPSRRP